MTAATASNSRPTLDEAWGVHVACEDLLEQPGILPAVESRSAARDPIHGERYTPPFFRGGISAQQGKWPQVRHRVKDAVGQKELAAPHGPYRPQYPCQPPR